MSCTLQPLSHALRDTLVEVSSPVGPMETGLLLHYRVVQVHICIRESMKNNSYVYVVEHVSVLYMIVYLHCASLRTSWFLCAAIK